MDDANPDTEREQDTTGDGTAEQSEGQVSEVASMDDPGEPIQPADAVAGAPDQTAGTDRPQEGTTGPDAPPRHGIPEDSNESAR